MKKSFAYPYGVWLAVFILAPILMVVVYAFLNADGGFTLHNFSYLPGFLPIFGRSFWLAFLSTAVCLVLGYPMAYLMSRLSASRQSLCMMLIMLPMWINFLLRTYAWMSILENNGLLNQLFQQIGLIDLYNQIAMHFASDPAAYVPIDHFQMIGTQGAVVLGMVYNYLPFMILPIYSVIIKMDNSLLEAAQDLGASTTKTLVRVLIPMSVPGISTGITMVFVPAVSTFVISRMLGGGSNLLIGDLIEMQFLGNSYNLNVGSAMSLVLMIIVLLCMSFTSSFDEDEMEGVS